MSINWLMLAEVQLLILGELLHPGSGFRNRLSTPEEGELAVP
jgi:hypothetical protein